MAAPLRIVAPPAPAEPLAAARSVADLGARIRQLQAEARALAAEQVDELVASLRQTQRLSLEVADGGDAYPPGVRDLARRIAEESVAKLQTLEVLMKRA